jgi:PAS domain S-box-containing protein
VAQKQSELAEGKSFVENVLGTLTNGVLVFDADMRLTSANPGAERILGVTTGELQGLKPDEISRAFGEPASRNFARADHWEEQVEIAHPAEDGEEVRQALLLRGSRMAQVGDTPPGYLIVCDDITGLVAAQRSAAWGEVARRLAHEIKNPLTPIQLSAERLQMRLDGKLDEADHAVMLKGTNTIINQVAAMQRMVDDFRDYARTPPAVLAKLDLNELVGEVLQLYETSRAKVVVQLAESLPEIRGDANQLRQVIHNLLQNAEDACEGLPEPIVTLVTRQDREWAVLSVQDNGVGFPNKIINRAFEPYVTTKPKGTGLGLAIVKKIMDEHEARISLANLDAQGQPIAPLEAEDGSKVSGAMVKLQFPLVGKAMKAHQTELFS